MLLEQCGHIVENVQFTVIWLDEDQIHVCFVNWLDYYFVFRNISAFHFQLCRLLKQHVFHCARNWASGYKLFNGVGSFYWWECSGMFFLSYKKTKSHQRSFLVYKKIAWTCVDQGNFGSQWTLKSSSNQCKGWILYRGIRTMQASEQVNGQRNRKIGRSWLS